MSRLIGAKVPIEAITPDDIQAGHHQRRGQPAADRRSCLSRCSRCGLPPRAVRKAISGKSPVRGNGQYQSTQASKAAPSRAQTGSFSRRSSAKAWPSPACFAGLRRGGGAGFPGAGDIDLEGRVDTCRASARPCRRPDRHRAAEVVPLVCASCRYPPELRPIITRACASCFQRLHSTRDLS